MEIDAARIESYNSIYNSIMLPPNATFEIFPPIFPTNSQTTILPYLKVSRALHSDQPPLEFYSHRDNNSHPYEIFEARIEASRDRLADIPLSPPNGGEKY